MKKGAFKKQRRYEGVQYLLQYCQSNFRRNQQIIQNQIAKTDRNFKSVNVGEMVNQIKFHGARPKSDREIIIFKWSA